MGASSGCQQSSNCRPCGVEAQDPHAELHSNSLRTPYNVSGLESAQQSGDALFGGSVDVKLSKVVLEDESSSTSRNGRASALGADRGSAVQSVSRAESSSPSYFCQDAEELRALPPRTGLSATQRERRKHVFKTGSVYDGEWVGNMRDGIGVHVWPDGAEYKGEWRQNVVTGRGIFKHSDGDVYVGEWSCNLAHGNGIYRHKEGTTYAGQFVEDLQHGHGKENWPDTSHFAGQFIKGRKYGEGIYVWPDGSTYNGQWRENQIDGFGTYEGIDKRHYDGKWQSSSMHGCGRYVWPDGRSYHGQYCSDQKDGFGSFTWADGRCYKGQWAAGVQHGVGLVSEPSSGVEHSGQWKKGEMISRKLLGSGLANSTENNEGQTDSRPSQ